MILLLLLLVLTLGAGAAGLLGIGILSADNRRGRTGLLALLSAPAVLGFGVLLLAVVVIGLGGPGGGPGEPDPPPATPATTAVTTARPSSTQPLPNARIERASADIPVVRIDADDDDRFAPYRQVSGLAPGAVVRVLAEGFEWHEKGSIEQCVTELGRHTVCGEAFPVQFDGDGMADFQFGVRGDISPGGCRAGQATCLLRLTGRSTGRVGTAQTVLVDSVAAGQVRVEPAGALTDGQTVDVVVSGFPPGTATAVLCAPPYGYDARRCSLPTPGATFAVDGTGAGRTTLTVAAGRLGTDAALCGPRRVCGVAVVGGAGFVAAPVTPVRFALGPGVAYEAGRVLPGVLVALVLAGLGVAIAVRTDWTKPTEAATPELDDSDLRADQSLDDLFGTDEEIDERDPILW